MTRIFLLVGLLATSILIAASAPSESDALRASLGRAVHERDAAIAQAKQDRQTLEATLATLGRSGKVTANAVTGHTAQMDKAAVESATQSQDAVQAAVNAAIANDQAVMAARDAKDQLDTLQRMSEKNNTLVYVTSITSASGILTLMLGYFFTARTNAKNHEWAVEAHELATRQMADVKIEAHNAYTEANTVNNKIAAIGVEMKDHKPLAPATH